MSVVVTYALAAFPNGRVKARQLAKEIAATPALAGRVLEGISSDRASCFLTFDAALSGAETTALDAVVAAHQGNEFVARVYASHPLVMDAKAVTVAIIPLGYTRSNPVHLGVEVAQLKLRIMGEGATVAAGTQLRLIETVGGADVDVTGWQTFPGTGGAFQQFQFDTNTTLREGEATYRLEGRLNGATSANVRGVIAYTYDRVQV